MPSWTISHARTLWSNVQGRGTCVYAANIFRSSVECNLMATTGTLFITRLLMAHNGYVAPDCFEDDEFVFRVDVEKETEQDSGIYEYVGTSGNITINRSDLDPNDSVGNIFVYPQFDLGDKIDDLLVPDCTAKLRLTFVAVKPSGIICYPGSVTDSHSDLWYNVYDVWDDPLRSYLTFQVVTRDNCIGAPRNVTVPAIAPESGVSVSWVAGEPSIYQTGNPEAAVVSYKIYRAVDDGSDDMEFEQVGTCLAAYNTYVDASVTAGVTYRYKVQAISGMNGLYSVLSEQSGAVYVDHAPAVPVFEGTNGAIYNPRPRLLLTLGSDVDAETLAVSSDYFDPSKRTAFPGDKIIIRRSTALTASGYEDAYVAATDAAGNVVSAERNYHYIKPVWTDDPVVAGETHVKAVHINELRTALNNIAAHYGMEPFVWASGEVVAGTTSRLKFPTHIEELQNAVRSIISYVNNWESLNSQHRIENVTMRPVLRPIASAVNQLREIIETL